MEAIDALAQNNSAIEVTRIDELKVIATELVTKFRSSVTIDWQHPRKRPSQDPHPRPPSPPKARLSA